MAQKRLVLSDASPLIALAATGTFGLLRELFGAVSVTAERLFEHGFHYSPELARSLLKDVGED